MARNIPNCNRSFLIESLLENKRIDNRTFFEFRDLQVNFGQTFGSCYVQLGQTLMFASTEATLDEPRVARPSEGRFKVSINIGAGGKEKWLRNLERSQPTEAVLTIRILERIMNQISVLDLESLCLITGKRVWCIKTKLVLLNYDGNLVEVASIATIASLMHFKRPDATITPDGDVIVHSFEERNPIPLTLFHYPICVTFQFMDHTHLKKILNENQEILASQHQNWVRKATQLVICDPTEEEEDFLHNVLIICANAYKEIVAIQSIGPMTLSSSSKQLFRLCSNKAFERVRFVTEYLKKCLKDHSPSDMFQRYGFHEAMTKGDLFQARIFELHPVLGQKRVYDVPMEEEVGLGGPSKWTVIMDDSIRSTNDVKAEENPEPEPDSPALVPTVVKKPIKTFSSIVRKSNDERMPTTAESKKQPTIVEKPCPVPKKAQGKKKNAWTVVDKKKAATEAEIKSTIKKLEDKKAKDKKLYQDESDDDEEEIVPLKWEFNNKKKK